MQIIVIHRLDPLDRRLLERLVHHMSDLSDSAAKLQADVTTLIGELPGVISKAVADGLASAQADEATTKAVLDATDAAVVSKLAEFNPPAADAGAGDEGGGEQP